MKEYVELLRHNEAFSVVREGVKKERPTVPPYTHSPDNTEEWKSLSNMQRGFDLCYSLFTGDQNE